MDDHGSLLSLAKEAVLSALQTLVDMSASLPAYRFAVDLPREVKATADRVLDEEILRRLAPTGLSLLSEESGELVGTTKAGLRWIVDPLDGTVNFVRRLAPCAVSIALYHEDSPIFGVIGEYPTLRLAWGGPFIGAYVEHHPVRVSKTNEKNKAVLCTGFPARFDFDGRAATLFIKRVSAYGKVRMLGAASLSLLQVAKGSADAYAEQDIMLWDVAAGLALVGGAGGHISVSPGRYPHSLNIFASNGLLQLD